MPLETTVDGAPAISLPVPILSVGLLSVHTVTPQSTDGAIQ